MRTTFRLSGCFVFLNQSLKALEQDSRWKMAENLECLKEESSEAVEEGEGSEGRWSALFLPEDRREGGFDPVVNHNKMMAAVAF